ncbi:MAG: chromosomal replication initiator protein DnaA [Clostridia bacterium]|nr:chromosomal replication initiator protein DnaA [Clostridia bacterium]
MVSYNDIWEMVKEYCRQKESSTIYSLWIEPLNLVSFEDSKVVLSTTAFKSNIVRSKFSDMLHEAFEATMGFPIDIEIVAENETGTAVSPAIQEDPKEPQGNSGNPEMTFDTFVVGSSNKFAHAAALAVASTPGKAYNPLFIYGNSGLGKTHLMNAICAEVKKDTPDAKIIYTCGEDFTNELISSIEKKTMQQFHDKYRTVDLLLMDDIQFIGGKTQTQEEFFHTFNTLVNDSKQIVLTSDRPPKEIPLLEERIKTRFEWGLLADIQPPDFETRMAIIKRKADYYDLELSDEVVQYIAEKIKNNVRQLEGTVKKINAYYTISGQKPSIAMAQKAIKDILSDNEPVPVTIDKILNEVARTYGTTVENITSDKRNANISKARQAAMYIVREVTNLSMEKIGEAFGNKHHSTVIYNIREAEKNMNNDPSVRSTIQSIINNINENNRDF